MKIVIDTASKTLELNGTVQPLYSDESFELISDLWVKVGWNQKYSYAFSWLGIPLIQLPEDVMRFQEAVWAVQPDVIVETGIAHGGSAILSASLLKVIGKGRVIAVDIDIRPHNREKIEAHPLSSMITLIEGSSTSPGVVAQIKEQIAPDAKVLVVLDSHHSYDHVVAELAAYSPMVTTGSYIISTDGVMRDLFDVPRGDPTWTKDNPAQAAIDFAAEHADFTLEQPRWVFNESTLNKNITHWPSAWLRRSKPAEQI